MKSYKFLSITALILVSVAYSCKKDAATSNFDKSNSAWQAYKQKVNNTYAYTAVTDNKVSAATSTKITVTKGEVTARDFYGYSYVYNQGNATAQKVVTEEWHESAADHTLSTHGSEGANLSTLDEIYYKAQNVWLKANPNTNVITFETNNNGLISVAGYAAKSCEDDDCFIGIRIQSITP